MSRKKTTSDFIAEAVQLHGDKYDYSSVEYKNNKEKVIIKCKKHGEFLQSPGHHLSGQGCPICRYEKVSKTLTRGIDEVVSKANNVHSNTYDYSLITQYNNDREKLPIICKIHGVFYQTMNNHINGGQGCPECGREKNINSRKLSFDEFVKRANEKHDSMYEYVETDISETGSNTKVEIICPIHGTFRQKISNHLFGQGCPKCSCEKTHEKQKTTTEDFIGKAKRVHGERYSYGNVVYNNNTEDVSITCRKHGDFMQRPNNHLQGNGCPLCVDFSSNGEKEIVRFIKTFYKGIIIQGKRGILPDRKEIDIYIPGKNVGIEYNGIYWHSESNNPDRKYHLKKTEQCAEKGIRLIHVFEDEWTDLKKREILKSMLKNILGYTGEKIYARKCSVGNVEAKEARKFLNENHIQGACGSKTRLGLYYNGELVSIMCFGKTRHFIGNDKHDTELLRFCNKINTNVIGGASKLFKHYVIGHSNESIVSYADRRWSVGKLYDVLGFNLYNKSKPNYFYVVGRQRKNRFSFRKSELVRRYNCPKELSEHEFCKSKGWYRIYDCGCLCYEWKMEKK